MENICTRIGTTVFVLALPAEQHRIRTSTSLLCLSRSALCVSV